jgi:hypothetical protein
MKPLVLNVIAPDVARVELIDASSLNVKLGESIEALKFKLFDKENNSIAAIEQIAVTIESDYFEISCSDNSSVSTSSSIRKVSNSSSIGFKECVNPRNNVFEMDCAHWKMIPLTAKLSAIKQLKFLSGEEFALTVKLVSRSQHRLCPTTKFTLSVFSGLPNSIVSLTNVTIKLNSEPKSMRLKILDQWGNTTAPLTAREQWFVKLLGGPLEFIGPQRGLPVNRNGEVIFMNNLVPMDDYEVNYLDVAQHIVLHSASGSEMLKTSIPIKIEPSYVPTTLQVNDEQFLYFF